MPMTIHGWGFSLQTLESENLFRFIKNHRETVFKSAYANRGKIIYNRAVAGDAFGLVDLCKNSGYAGTGAVISNIMSTETGVQFRYFHPEENSSLASPVILFDTDINPAYRNKRSKTVTRDEVFAICQEYINELGLNTNPSDIEFLTGEDYDPNED